jgi:hypothetical protein
MAKHEDKVTAKWMMREMNGVIKKKENGQRSHTRGNMGS